MTIRSIAAALTAFALTVAAIGLPAGVAAIDSQAPPDVRPGSALSNCERIIAAGYAPHDYVSTGGQWLYLPDWSGPDGARMSYIWGSVQACRLTAEGTYVPRMVRSSSQVSSGSVSASGSLGGGSGFSAGASGSSGGGSGTRSAQTSEEVPWPEKACEIMGLQGRTDLGADC